MRERNREREGTRERRRDGDKWEQRQRRVGLHSLLHPCVLRAEGGDCWWFGHTVYSFHVTSARQCLLCQ